MIWELESILHILSFFFNKANRDKVELRHTCNVGPRAPQKHCGEKTDPK